MAIIAEVVQSRVIIAVLAVIGPNRVTPGAGQWVPISGCSMVYLVGQVTCPASLSTAAARSEPSGLLRRTTGTPGTMCTPVRRRARVHGVPGVQVVQVSTRGARSHRVRTSAYTGTPKARLGQAGAGAVLERCQERCQNRARTVPEAVP